MVLTASGRFSIAFLMLVLFARCGIPFSLRQFTEYHLSVQGNEQTTILISETVFR